MRLYLPQRILTINEIIEINWNTLTLVLHRCVILSLVELKFMLKNLECLHGKLHGELHGEFHGEPVGAARGLLPLECCFCRPGVLVLPGCSPGHCRIGILRVEWNAVDPVGSCRI